MLAQRLRGDHRLTITRSGHLWRWLTETPLDILVCGLDGAGTARGGDRPVPECQILRCQHGTRRLDRRRSLLSPGHPILGPVEHRQLLVSLGHTTVPTGRPDGIRPVRQGSMGMGMGGRQVIHDFMIEEIAGSG